MFLCQHVEKFISVLAWHCLLIMSHQFFFVIDQETKKKCTVPVSDTTLLVLMPTYCYEVLIKDTETIIFIGEHLAFKICIFDFFVHKLQRFFWECL